MVADDCGHRQDVLGGEGSSGGLIQMAAWRSHVEESNGVTSALLTAGSGAVHGKLAALLKGKVTPASGGRKSWSYDFSLAVVSPWEGWHYHH